jgi:hypothetical protein
MRKTLGLDRITTTLRPIVLLAALATVIGVVLRFAYVPDVLCRSPDELSELMPGLRLHGLPLLNLGDEVRYNFFKSLFYSHHGLGDVSFYYLASSALGLARLPLSEYWLFVCGGLTTLALAAMGAMFAHRVLRSTAAAWLVATFVMLSPFYTFVANSGWARLAWTPLLVLILFLAQERAMRQRTRGAIAVFWILAGFLSLTDGFIMFPLLAVLGWLLVDAPTVAARVRRLLRDRVLVTGVVVFALGIAFEVTLGLAARHRGTNLTMIAYVIFKGAGGAWIPSRAVLAAWAEGVDWYLPFSGSWIAVLVACLFAAREGLRGKMPGFLSAWWLLASIGVIRYAAGQESAGSAPGLGWLNAYQLAMPTFLLLAWFIAAAASGEIAPFRSFPVWLRASAAYAMLLPIIAVFVLQARNVATAPTPDYGMRIEQLSAAVPPGYDTCHALKAAAYYVRAHETTLPYVFQLSPDVYLGHIGEFYYGLSYSRSSRPEEPNHLLDFGVNQFGKSSPPEAFYRPYGVEHFDYYVDFLMETDPLKVKALERLEREGARVVCVIRDGGRPIGRVLSFRESPAVEIDYRDAARQWDRTFARPGTLFQEPLAGTSYHFGYNWRRPDS